MERKQGPVVGLLPFSFRVVFDDHHDRPADSPCPSCPVGGETFVAGGAIGVLLGGLIVFTGWTGLILGVVGSFGTFFRRLADPELREYSSFSDYFNILFISMFFLSACITCLFVDPLLGGARAYVFGLLTGEALSMPMRRLRVFSGGSHHPGLSSCCLRSPDAYVPYVHEIFLLSQDQMG